jgi:hypothetical protein
LRQTTKLACVVERVRVAVDMSSGSDCTVPNTVKRFKFDYSKLELRALRKV